MTLDSSSASPRCSTVPGSLLLLPSLLMAPQGRVSMEPVGITTRFHLDLAHFHLPPAHPSPRATLCFRVLSAPSRVPKEERREVAELQPPKPPPKRQSLYRRDDQDATAAKLKKRLLHLTLQHLHSPVCQTPTHLLASPQGLARLLRCRPRGKGNE